MLTLYRRHTEDCGHRADGRRYNRCKCPIWVQGSLLDEVIRESMATRNWSQAAQTILEWQTAGTRKRPEPPTPEQQPQAPKIITIAEACAAFEREMIAQKLRESSQKKYKMMLRQLKAFAVEKGLATITELDYDATEAFRQMWNDCAASSAGKRLERLRTFQRYCVSHGWLPENFAKKLKRPQAKPQPTLPYTLQELKRLLNACDALAVQRPKHGRAKLQRLRVLMLLMRYSGLRIGDACALAADKIDGQRLFLYTAKTGTPVFTKLPQFLIDELDRCPRLSPNYFFWTGNGTKEALEENYRRVFREIAVLAKVTSAHPHRFRDTFAVELLQADIPIEQVSILLGHSSVKVTEKHYAPWVRARQQRLEENLERALKRDPLAMSFANTDVKLRRVK